MEQGGAVEGERGGPRDTRARPGRPFFPSCYAATISSRAMLDGDADTRPGHRRHGGDLGPHHPVPVPPADRATLRDTDDLQASRVHGRETNRREERSSRGGGQGAGGVEACVWERHLRRGTRRRRWRRPRAAPGTPWRWGATSASRAPRGAPGSAACRGPIHPVSRCWEPPGRRKKARAPGWGGSRGTKACGLECLVIAAHAGPQGEWCAPPTGRAPGATALEGWVRPRTQRVCTGGLSPAGAPGSGASPETRYAAGPAPVEMCRDGHCEERPSREVTPGRRRKRNWPSLGRG